MLYLFVDLRFFRFSGILSCMKGCLLQRFCEPASRKDSPVTDKEEAEVRKSATPNVEHPLPICTDPDRYSRICRNLTSRKYSLKFKYWLIKALQDRHVSRLKIFKEVPGFDEN